MRQTDLIPTSQLPAPPPERVEADELLKAFFSRLAPTTVGAYRFDLEDFGKYLKCKGTQVADRLIAAGQGKANYLVMAYRDTLKANGLAHVTCNRRIVAIKSLMKLARILGLVSWSLDVTPLKAVGPRDMRGPGKEGFLKLIAHFEKHPDKMTVARNVALCWLLFGLALRRSEAVSLSIEHITADKVWVLGKGREKREPLTLAGTPRDKLRHWLEVGRAGAAPTDPVFISLDPVNRGHRLTASAVYKLIRGAAHDAGLGVVRPHGLRHAAITQALDVTDGDVRKVAKFSRHRSVETVMRYDDARQDYAGEISEQITKE